MATILERFKVHNFRSIEESDWIEIADNTCLVGTNEAGKTNLLLALWKLRPANNEPIIPLDDFPRHMYSQYKADGHSEDVFISADFILDDDLQEEIANELECDFEQVSKVLIKRKYNGEYHISFPYSKIDEFDSKRIVELLSEFESDLNNNENFQKEDESLKKHIQHFIAERNNEFSKRESVKSEEIASLKSEIKKFMTDNFGRKKGIAN